MYIVPLRQFPLFLLCFLPFSLSFLSLFILFFLTFIYLWQCWVFVAACRLSLVVVNGALPCDVRAHCGGFSCHRTRVLQELWHTHLVVGSSPTRDRTHVPALAGGFLTTEPLGKPSPSFKNINLGTQNLESDFLGLNPGSCAHQLSDLDLSCVTLISGGLGVQQLEAGHRFPSQRLRPGHKTE